MWESALIFVNRVREQQSQDRTEHEDENGEDEERTGSIIEETTEEILSRHRLVTIEESREILYYKNGVYAKGGEVLIEKIGEELYGYNFTSRHLTEINGHIIRRTYHKHEELDADINIINLKNGLYNIETEEFKDHTPEYLSINQFPICYDSKAGWVGVLKFLKQIQNKEGVVTLIKMFGYILLSKSTKHQKAFFFAGKGDNGKSVLIDLIEAFVGEDNCSSVKLHDLKNDKFMRAQMYGKIVNTYADIPATSLQDVGIFKALVSGDKMTAQHKYGKLFDFRNRAKLIFSGNSIPLSEGEDELAYFKRWVILRFNSLFKGDRQDKDLIKKLTTPENLSGLFNLALFGVKLLEREGFPNTPIQVIREEYDRQSISHKRFTEDKCISNPEKQEYYITKSDYYDSYLRYCLDNEYEPLTDDQVEVELSLMKIFGKRKRKDCWIGIITHEEAERRNQEILERQRQDTLE
jgi:putative DNA primase/helicase